jgi:hypothetical protein
LHTSQACLALPLRKQRSKYQLFFYINNEQQKLKDDSPS